MKREEKNALSKQRILDAALREFSEKGYGSASLNTLCSENDISKGIIYHYFRDKDELYLICVKECFDELTEHLKNNLRTAEPPEVRLQEYFDSRLSFFAKNPDYLGVFLSAVLSPPPHLAIQLAQVRKPFDEQNIMVLTGLLESAQLRKGITANNIIDDFKMYMDYFNARFRSVLESADTPKQALQEHEERCHRQLGILLYGILEK